MHLAAGEGPVRCRVFARDRLVAGDRVTGPAIFEQLDATTLVLPGQEATVLDRGDVRIASLAMGVAGGPDAATAGGRR